MLEPLEVREISVTTTLRYLYIYFDDLSQFADSGRKKKENIDTIILQP